MKTLSILFTAIFAIFLIHGCTPKAATKEEAAYTPTFDYSPPTSATPASANVTFALVNATYSENQPWANQWPFTDFSKNMALDFQELLAARGFTVKGPFGSYDELAFPDKKGSDLVLQPALEVRFEVVNPKSKKHVGLLGPDTYSLQGDASVGGRVTLSMMESLSKERMWFKSIELPRNTVRWEGSKRYEAQPAGVDFSDPAISNSVGKVMETYYRTVMEAAWKYLDPEEMKLVKKQADEIKAKKVY